MMAGGLWWSEIKQKTSALLPTPGTTMHHVVGLFFFLGNVDGQAAGALHATTEYKITAVFPFSITSCPCRSEFAFIGEIVK